MALAAKPIQREPSSNSVVHPYDLPKSIEISFDPTTRYLTLRFNYIVAEPYKDIKIGVHGLFPLGKNSNRIFSLSLSNVGLYTPDHVFFSFFWVSPSNTGISLFYSLKCFPHCYTFSF